MDSSFIYNLLSPLSLFENDKHDGRNEEYSNELEYEADFVEHDEVA